ncbi:hypothetical protein BKA62DRAFT_667295 [Auriculariales sp. MPI-PUGE-AT-0066]|nr:hypothetical protein BKA62DRAFT_667295 [Auriculariales sp. MPI-PUGE-AT-0066]
MSGTPLLPFELADSELLLVSDHLQAKADFLLVRIVAQRLKSPPDSRRTVLVSFHHDTARWNALAARTGVSLKVQAEEGNFTLLDAPPEASPIALWNLIEHHIPILSENTVISLKPVGLLLLDGLNFWDWIGVPLVEMKRVLRAIHARCIAANVALVVTYHSVGGPGSEPRDLSNHQDPLYRLLLELNATHVEVLPLASGKSGAVSGEASQDHGQFNTGCLTAM